LDVAEIGLTDIFGIITRVAKFVLAVFVWGFETRAFELIAFAIGAFYFRDRSGFNIFD